MNIEISNVMATEGKVIEWAGKIKYNVPLTTDDNNISKVLGDWAINLGKTGCDPDHELSQMITKAITREAVTSPSELITALFNEGTIGEFDDFRGEVEPKNTINVYESINGGNVDRSFVDHSVLAPTWKSLQAETDVGLATLRSGGYKTVANLITFITEAMEQKKVSSIISILDAAILNGAANYINEATTAPTETSAKALALYLQDVTDGTTPLIFGLNKYIQTIAGLTGATTYLTDAVKNQYNTTGFIKQYAGSTLIGLSGQKKLADGSFIIPNNRLFGAAGKIGDAITRGDTQVLQETDINSEKIHIKVSGYQFGTCISDITKAAKVVIA